MGAAVSNVQNNDELVDSLMKSGYIRTRGVEKVFRAVDRANYVVPSYCKDKYEQYKDRAYSGLAWKHGDIHLSAPRIYSEVMESLLLEPGLSFLNLGSGTGYLSTMAGLILNQHGINHGIELYEDCLRYANERLEEFKKKSLALDEFDFCEPVFIQGNCLNVTLGKQYDRVYCGATCPENYEGFIKQFVRIGGILIMPFKGNLLRVLRISEHTWLHFNMFPALFTTLVVPTTSEQTLFHLPKFTPLSLQESCRGKIRRCLRLNVWREHEEILETKKLLLPEERQSVSDEMVSNEFDELRSVCALLSVDAVPRDLYTISQVCNMNESQSWQVVNGNGCVDSYSRNLENFSNINRSVSRIEETNDVQNTSNSTEESQSNAGAKNFTNGSETEQDEMLVQQKKVAKREKTDSGIVEDVNLSNENSSSGSITSPSDLESVDPEDMTDTMDEDPLNPPCDQEVIIARYVNTNALSTYMKEKIHQLPLPFSSKLYLNYNRKL